MFGCELHLCQEKEKKFSFAYQALNVPQDWSPRVPLFQQQFITLPQDGLWFVAISYSILYTLKILHSFITFI